jgi:hypothetical protein
MVDGERLLRPSSFLGHWYIEMQNPELIRARVARTIYKSGWYKKKNLKVQRTSSSATYGLCHVGNSVEPWVQ